MAKPIVKVSGISSLTDARYCAGMEVEFLGIAFDTTGGSPVSRTHFASISGWIEGPQWVCEYDGQSLENLLELVAEYGFETVQVNSLAMANACIAKGLKTGLRVNIAELDTWLEVPDNLAFVVIPFLDTVVESDHFLPGLEEKAVVLAEQITRIDEVEVILTKYPGLGFNLYSGEEDRPGWMDLSGLQDVLELIDEAQNQ